MEKLTATAAQPGVVATDAAPPGVVAIDSGSYRTRFLERRNELVEENQHLVVAIARSIIANLPPSFDRRDLESVGNIALLHAATSYRPREHGCAPFSAYARPIIRGAILESVRRKHYRENTRPPIREAPERAVAPATSPESIDHGRKVQRVREAIASLPKRDRTILTEYYGAAEPKMDSIAKTMGITGARVRQLRSAAIRKVQQILAQAS